MKPFEIAKQWLQAFNDHNLEKLLSLYDDNAEHFSPKVKARQPESKGIIKGKAALRNWWQDAFNRLPDLAYHEKTITADDNRAFMEYTRVVSGEDKMVVAEVLEIKNDLIVASRVYHS